MARKILPSSIEGGQRFLLTSAQRANLAKMGRRTLTPAQEKRINTLCTDYIIGRSFEREGISPSGVSETYKRLKIRTVGLLNILDQLVNHVAVRSELDECLAKLNSWPFGLIATVYYALIDLHSAAEKCKNES